MFLYIEQFSLCYRKLSVLKGWKDLEELILKEATEDGILYGDSNISPENLETHSQYDNPRYS